MSAFVEHTNRITCGRLEAASQLSPVTENAVDFVHATSCTVLLVRKDWWPSEARVARLAGRLDRWAHAHPNRAQLGPLLDSHYR